MAILVIARTLTPGAQGKVSNRSGGTLRISHASAITGALAIIVSLSSAGTAQAIDPNAEAHDIAGQIADVAPDAQLADTVDLGDLLLAPVEGGVVALPVDLSAPVEIMSTTGEGADLSVSLPDLAGSDDARLADDGTVVYTTDEAASVAVQPLADGGTRFLTVLEDRAAPSTYAYDFNGADLELLEDGSVSMTQNGVETGTIDAPWAYDANGTAVPTHYVVQGETLTQVVDHTAGDYAYPISADPSVWWWLGTTATCVAQIAPFVTPIAAVKAGQLMTKAQTIINKSTKLKAAVSKMGGLKNALGAIKTFIVNKGAGLSAGQISAIKSLYAFGLETIADALGIGACYSLVRELV